MDNNIDLKVVASLKEYYKKGIYFGIVKSVSEDEGNINAYVEFNEPIGGIPSLFVPVNQLYNIPSFTPLQSSLCIFRISSHPNINNIIKIMFFIETFS